MKLLGHQIWILKRVTIGSLIVFGATVAVSFVVPPKGVILDVVATLMQLSFVTSSILGAVSVIVGWKRDRTALIAGLVGVLIAALGGAFLIAYLATD